MANPPAAEPLAVYRYKREPTPLEKILLGAWVVYGAALLVAFRDSTTFPGVVSFVIVLALYIKGFPGWHRSAALEIHKDRIHCEVLPGKTKTIWFATIVELAESDFDLRVTHLTDKGHASFSLWKKHFGEEKWPEIVAAITSAASRQSPRLQVHVLKACEKPPA